MQFLALLEDEETEAAIELAQKILVFEPRNQLIKNLYKALQLKLAVDLDADTREGGETSSDAADEDGDEDDDSNSENDSDDDTDAMASEAKDVEL
ncbi:Aste57867_21888 [Aphanomyces stellatus]|uniref:Aste57867_21888 protein n=1 Tax=Aphanomyces stellatus TaxID=120398 RepID=A0A485LJD6_9STRA|nr:hypothetical protein As57867_021819 [Aphanomyces stellatus]VFT98556.1 Aste57867_21888 [Aphanomyces stellatus]